MPVNIDPRSIEQYGIHDIWTRQTDERKQEIPVGDSCESTEFVPTGMKYPLYDTDVDLTAKVSTTKGSVARRVVDVVIDDMRENLKDKLDGTSGDPTSGNPTCIEFIQRIRDPNKKVRDDAIEYQRKLELGDRFMWEQVLADALARRKMGFSTDPKDSNPIADRKEAYARYAKILKLKDKYANATNFVKDNIGNKYVAVKLGSDGAPLPSETTLNNSACWDVNADFISYIEKRKEVGDIYVWKSIPQSAVGKAYLGIAAMMLDDVGRGRDDDQLKGLYGENKEVKTQLAAGMALDDAILTVAISYSQKAYNILTDESNPTEAKERDFYAVGRAIITEAKLRALRRTENPRGTVIRTDFPNVNGLWEALINDGYIIIPAKQQYGVIQPKFDGKYENIVISIMLDEKQKKEVFNVLQQAPNKETSIQGDSNGYIKHLYDQWLDNYDISDKQVTILGQSKGVEDWMKSNKKLQKYGLLATPGAADTDVIPLAKIGVVYLRETAKLEIAKLAMEADDDDYDKAVKEVKAAIEMADSVYNNLVDEKGRIPVMSKDVSNEGKLYADKTADYLAYDALKTKADLMALLGNIIGGETVMFNGKETDGDTLLAQANQIYKGIDDVDDPNINNPIIKEGENRTKDVAPYQDIRDLAANAELSLRRQLEKTDLKQVSKDIEKYYDPSSETKKEYLAATVYKKSFMYYSVLYNEAVSLNLRNSAFGEYTINQDSNKGVEALNKLMKLPGSAEPEYNPGKNKVLVCDAAMARSLSWDGINGVENVKAVNRKGIRDLKYRDYLEAAKSEARLIKILTSDDAKMDKVDSAIKMFENIIISLADGKAVSVDQEYSNLISNTKRKYNRMDYPFYAELYNELASLYEQRAWIVTKDDRETLTEEDITKNSAKYQRIQAEFNKAINAYKRVYDPESKTGICMHKQIRGKYDKYVRPANIEIQLRSIETYKIPVERLATKYEDVYSNGKNGIITEQDGVITQIEAKMAELKQVKILEKTIEDLHNKSTITEDGVEKVQVGDKKLLKEAIDVLYARLYDTEAQLINKKIFFINKQVNDIKDPKDNKKNIFSTDAKEAWIKGLYSLNTNEQHTGLFDIALTKLIDPYYLIQSMIGASMVYMVYEKQKAVDNVYAYYKILGDGQALTYEMCEAFSITAAVNKDFVMARKIIKSLDMVIKNTGSDLEKPQKTDEQKAGYRDILSQSYMWKGNLLSWFYDERNENGDPGNLTAAKECFDNSLQYNPNNLSSKLNVKIVEYRIANLAYKNNTRADINGVNDAANLETLKNAYVGLVNACIGASDSSVVVVPVRKMTGLEMKMREEEYFADKAKASRALKTMAFNVLNLMQKDKYRLIDWKDIVSTQTGVYFEQRFMRGDIVNGTQLAKINAGRAEQKDETGVRVLLEPLTEDNGGVRKISTDATLSLAKVNEIFNAGFLNWLGSDITSIRNEDDMDKVSGGLFDKELKSRDRDLIDNDKYKMDQVQLKTFSVSDVEVHGTKSSDHAINYIVNPTQKNWDKFDAAAKELESHKDALVRAQAAADKANLMGWMAMSSENLTQLGQAVTEYEKVLKAYRDAGRTIDNEILKNYGEVLKIVYYKDRNETNFNSCINVYAMVSGKNNASLGGMADIDVSTMYIANASLYDSDVDKGRVFSAAMDKALEAVKFLTGKAFKETNRSKLTRYYIDYIKESDVLKKDKLVMEALSNLVMAEAWLYTTKGNTDRSANGRIGEFVDASVTDLSANYGFDIKDGVKGTVTIGANYLDIRKKLWEVYRMALPVAMRQASAPTDLNMRTANNYSDAVKDKDLRSYVHHLAHSGLVYTMSQIQASYGISEVKTSALRGAYNAETEKERFFENRYTLIKKGLRQQ